MAIVDGLTTLAAVKLEAGIATADTTNDTLLEALITSASAAARVYLKRDVKRTTYTDETYAVNNSQLLYLRQYPIQSVTSITLLGVTQTLGTDYQMSADDARAGRLYRALGWVGTYYTRGTFPDIYAGARDIKTTYVAGWYLPADVTVAPADPHYVAGDDSSLPLALSYACTRAVVVRFSTIATQADGLKQLSEGGLSYTWFGPENYSAGGGGFDSITQAMLAPYVRHEVAA